MPQWDDTTWFRSSGWDDAIADVFEKKVARARRHNRAQYLRIQALHLTGQDDAALRVIGRQLFQRVIDDYSEDDPVQAKSAMEQLGDSYFADGLLDDAERTLLLTLDAIRSSDIGRSGTSHLTELTLAELMFVRGDHDSLIRAAEFLDLAETEVDGQRAMFRNSYFRYLFTYARVAAALGNESARTFATLALDVADETDPPIPRHPDIGLPLVSAEQRHELEYIARGATSEHTNGAKPTLLRRVFGGRSS